MKCPVMSFDSLFNGVTLGSLYIEAQGCVPVLLENLHGMSLSGLVNLLKVCSSVALSTFAVLCVTTIHYLVLLLPPPAPGNP